jgi:hypothetical protein
MTDYAFYRGRLTGNIIEDTTDPNPVGERAALATVITEDSDVTGGTPIQTVARILLPSGAPCPVYAANLFFFSLVNGPVTIPVALAAMPYVTVRRDITNVAGTLATQSIVIEPTFIAKATTLWGSSAIAAYDNNYVSLEFWDYSSNAQAGKLGYFPASGSPLNIDIIQPGSQVLVTTRSPSGALASSPPSGYHHAWIVAPLNQGNTCPCLVTGGSGSVYTADFYANGPSNPVTESGATVTQLQITSDTVDVGTWVIAARVGGAWYMQVPIFYA